jgi:hypothetical protein
VQVGCGGYRATNNVCVFWLVTLLRNASTDLIRQRAVDPCEASQNTCPGMTKGMQLTFRVGVTSCVPAALSKCGTRPRIGSGRNGSTGCIFLALCLQRAEISGANHATAERSFGSHWALDRPPPLGLDILDNTGHDHYYYLRFHHGLIQWPWFLCMISSTF